MNKTPSWALATLSLTAILGCRLAPPVRCVSHQVSSPSYADSPGCSWESGHHPLTSASVSETKTPARLPYGFRWDDYQGSDIEHDIYGDRQRASCLGTIGHPHLVAGVSNRISGLLCIPKQLGCATTPCANQPTSDQAEEFGCDSLLALPEVPPLTIVPPVPDANPPATEARPIEPQIAEPSSPEPPPTEEPPLAEPTPTKPKEIPPRNVIPIPLPRLSAPPLKVPQETASPSLEASPEAAPPTSPLPPAQPMREVRLTPTLIVPAVPPATLKVSPQSETPRPALPRNSIPGHPGQ
jgi:hypothetical protein